MKMFRLKRTLNSSKLSKALFSSQISEYDSEKAADQRRPLNKVSRKTLGKRAQNFDKSGIRDVELDTLITSGPDNQARTDFFHKISEINDSDHSEAKATKNKIRKLIDEELEFHNFSHKVSEEQRLALLEDTVAEVAEQKSFFFRYDSNKAQNNQDIHNVSAPGNAHRHPSVALPHEHVHVDHYADVASLTPKKMQEIYGLYSYLVDLHISQIRPNLREESYIPPQFNQLCTLASEYTEQDIEDKFHEFYHRFRESTHGWKSQTQHIDYQKELDALPINHHPDEKGSIYDVEWTEDQKFPHVADRLGYPIFAVSPFEKIVGIELAPSHPSYQFQAFVQTPSMDPDPTLSFEKGETIYENTRIGEWIRLW